MSDSNPTDTSLLLSKDDKTIPSYSSTQTSISENISGSPPGSSSNDQNVPKKKKSSRQLHHHHHHHHHKTQHRQPAFPEDTFEHAVIDAYESVITDTEHEDEDEDTRWLRQERLSHKLMKWYKRPSLQMVSAVTFVFAAAVGISLSAKIQLFLQLACKKLMLEHPPTEGEETCRRSQLQVMVSQLQSLTSVAGLLITTLLAGKIGEFSDIHGRKNVILYTISAAFLSKIAILILVSPLVSTFHIWWLVGAHMIEACGGGIFVFLGMCNSYITDIVEDHLRIYSMGVVIASLFLGMSVGPVLGSFLVKLSGSNMTAIYADVGTTFAAFLVALFILPESRSENARTKSRRNSVSALEMRRMSVTSKKQYYYHTFVDSVNFFKPLKLLWLRLKKPDGSLDFRPRIVVLLILFIDVCLITCTAALGPIIVLYATYTFEWDSVQLGYYLAINSITKTLVLIFFSPFFLHRLKKKFKIEANRIDRLDITCIRFAVCFQVLSALTLTFAPSSVVYISHCFFLCFESIASPTLHSAVVKYASVENTGAMFGALATVRNLINLVMPALLLYIYSETVAFEPKATFYIQLGFCFLLVMTTWILSHKTFYKPIDETTSVQEEDILANLNLQREQRERIHKWMILRRSSSSSITSLPSSPVKPSSVGHSRKLSATIQPKR